MNISANVGSLLAYASNVGSMSSASQEVRESGPDNDGDRDDSRISSTQSASTVNMSGQTIGQNLNVTA